MKHELSDSAKQFLDMLSIATVLATLSDMLPSIAALFTICWTAIRIWETDTIRSWTGRKKADAKPE
jgi:hypothetical protein